MKAVGTHSGIVHVLDFHGNRVKSYRPHTVSVNDICIDSDGEFVATAAADGALHRVENPFTRFQIPAHSYQAEW